MKKKFLLILLISLISPLLFYGEEYPQPNSLYNEALVFYQEGQRGKSIQALKKTLLLNPSHKEARFLYNKFQNEIGALPLTENPISVFFLSAANIFSPQGDAVFSALLFLLGSLIAVLIWLNKISTKYQLVSLLLFIFSFFGTVQSLIKYYVVFKKDVRIALENSVLRDEALSDGGILEEIVAGSEFSVLGEKNNFVLVRSFRGKEGWVSLEILPPLWNK